MAAFFLHGLLLGIPAGAALAGTGTRQPVVAESPSADLMRALMAWAAPLVDLPAPSVLPTIVRKNHCEINAIARPGVECPDETPGTPSVRAMYSQGVMWLNEEWRADSIRDVSFLLHELVHHMQFHAGVPEVPCASEALEKPAYAVHFAFLEAAGLDPYEVTGIGGLMLIFVTGCLDGR